MSGTNSDSNSKRSQDSVKTALPNDNPPPEKKEENPQKNEQPSDDSKLKEGEKAMSVEAVAPAKNDLEPFLEQLYTTSDDEKIIAGLKTKKTSKELAAAAAKEAVSTTKTVQLETTSASKSQNRSKKRRRSRSAGTSRIMRGNRELTGKPTILTFRALQERPTIARCVLVLCNISEIRLNFVLKSSDSSVVASTGSGYIAPHAQLRIILTWTRSSKHSNWLDVPQQKLLLATQFLDGADSDKYAVTHTRLMGRVGMSKTCTLADPPVEQLLLDAVGPQSPPPAQPPMVPPSLGKALADFVNNLTDRGLCVLSVVMAVFVLVCCGDRRK